MSQRTKREPSRVRQRPRAKLLSKILNMNFVLFVNVISDDPPDA